MTGVRKALIVATDEYGDPKLTRLNAPAEDARALAAVLEDPSVGAFEVKPVVNQNCHDVEVAIAEFFAAGARGDTLLVHFSCHGVKDISGELYFATKDTRLNLLKVTAVPSAMVRDAMETSRASLILCLVDCCYSGAFTKSTKAAATVDLTERLGGNGRAVITASTSLQLALDGEEAPSLFTHAVVEGLRSGEADRDLDGLVSLDEFYSYVHDRVTAQNPDQTPVKSFDVRGDVYVARRGGPITTPAALPRELLETLVTGEDWQRLGAVSKLADFAAGDHPGRALAARLRLEHVRDHDDSLRVRAAATNALAAAGETEEMPEIPDYVDSGDKGPVVEDVVDEDVLDEDLVDEDVVEEDVVEEDVVDEDVVKDDDVVVDDDLDDDNGGGGGSGGGGSGLSLLARHGKRLLAASAVGLLAVVLLVWAVLTPTEDDDEGDKTTSGGSASERSQPRLPERELLVPVVDGETSTLLAVDAESGGSREMLVGVDLPTLSHDRTMMSYLRIAESGDDGHRDRVAYASQIDLGRETPVLGREARSSCPSSSRPALSLDGGLLAFGCRDESGTSSGLWVVGVDDDELTAWVEDSRVAESPTWTGDGELVFVLADNGPGGESTLMRVDSPGAEPELLTEGTTGWDSHPDWSESGVLFLRSPDNGKIGDVYKLEGDGAVSRLTRRGDVESPTWSPDGKQIAYLAPGTSGGKSLWIQDARIDAEPTEIVLEGEPGAPAWGAR